MNSIVVAFAILKVVRVSNIIMLYLKFVHLQQVMVLTLSVCERMSLILISNSFDCL